MAVAAVVALLVVLLIEGCMSEHAKTASTTTDAVVVQPEPAPTDTAAPAPETKPITAPSTQPVATPVVTPAAPAPAPTPTKALPGSPRPQMLYVVKPGDTLSRIAHLNHTTVKALKAINSLNTDVIAIGARLKVPQA